MTGQWPTVELDKAAAAAALRAGAFKAPLAEHDPEYRRVMRERIAEAVRNGVPRGKLPGIDATVDRIMAVLDNPPTEEIVHSFVSFIGADGSLANALENVENADAVAWITHPLRHDLAVLVDGRQINYAIERPERKETP